MLKPFGLTYVIYDENDTFLLGPIMALLSLVPIFCIAAVLVHMLVSRDLRCMVVLSGQILTALSCTILKRIIRQPRPDHKIVFSSDHDFGMPSIHAAFVAFCATFGLYFALTQYTTNNNNNANTSLRKFVQWTNRWILPMSMILVGLGCAYSRIYLGYHTVHQVGVGGILGTVIGLLFGYVYDTSYKTMLAPYLEQHTFLGRYYDFRSYHDTSIDTTIAEFMANHLDEYRRKQNSITTIIEQKEE